MDREIVKQTINKSPDIKIGVFLFPIFAALIINYLLLLL